MAGNRKSVIAAAVLTALAGGAGVASAATWDLAADWSDTNNPAGAWSYRYDDITFGPSQLLGTHVNGWLDANHFVGDSQPAWVVTGAGDNSVPGLAKSNGTAIQVGGFGPLDFPIDRVGGHTPTSTSLALVARWTAPVATTVDLTGGTWMWRDLERQGMMKITKNGVDLFAQVNIPQRDDAIDPSSSNPVQVPGPARDTFTFNEAAIAAGSLPSVLQNIAVAPGDTIELRVYSNNGGDFIGMDFTVTNSIIPEPASAMLLLGAGSLALLRRRA
jgi:hypothetical protein